MGAQMRRVLDIYVATLGLHIYSIYAKYCRLRAEAENAAPRKPTFHFSQSPPR